MIDQPFQPRLSDGMIRCYMARDEVAGFGHQLIKALMPSPAGPNPHSQAANHVRRIRTCLSGSKTTDGIGLDARDDACVEHRSRVASVIWDADFLYGPKTESGEDSYVLCEINVSAVFPFPEQATAKIAQATVKGLLSA